MSSWLSRRRPYVIGLRTISKIPGRVASLHEPIFLADRQDLLGQRQESTIPYVLQRAFAEFGAERERPEHKIAAGNVLGSLRLLDIDSASEEEVDDALLEHRGRNLFRTLRILDDGRALGRLRRSLCFLFLSLDLGLGDSS